MEGNDDLKRSPASEYGHETGGYAVEFNLNGFACRSLTVENRGEAEAIESTLEEIDAVTSTEVVRDA